MRPDTASRTAERVALRRASHQLLDDPLVLPDPLALPILGRGMRSILTAAQTLDARPWDRPLRAFIVARTRYAEDELASAYAAGVRQYVVLGAGLDTFAYRNPHAALRVFEVDDPSSQSVKLERLQAANIAPPSSVMFVGVNFERETPPDRLKDAGFDAGAPAFFSWLGVVPYLSTSAVMEMLRWIASLPPPSAVVFDYAVPPAMLDAPERAIFDELAARVALVGEPWQTFFEPAQLEIDLVAAGFGRIAHVGRDAINQRYYERRGDGLRVSGALGRLMNAQVQHP